MHQAVVVDLNVGDRVPAELPAIGHLAAGLGVKRAPVEKHRGAPPSVA